MQLHYRVRSVLLSHGSSAVTLSPVEWGRDSATETTKVDGEIVPAWEECSPTEDDAEPIDTGGKLTELRFDGDTDWKPGTLVSLTATTWHDPHDL